MPQSLANVLLHTVNAALTAGLLWSLVARACPGLARREAGWVAVLGTLVWSLHPLRVEPVAWATGLPYLLAMAFTLAFARSVGEFGSVVFIAGNIPFVSEITPLIIITKLEQYDYAGATSVGAVMLSISFVMLLVFNLLQRWVLRREGRSGR